jgi:hypothetical protein
MLGSFLLVGSAAGQDAGVPNFTDSSSVHLDEPAPTRPPRLPYLDAAAYLSEVRGAWVYDFGTPGWPDGWSPFGVDPGRVGVLLDGIPFDDPVTGRPAYELLPYDKLISLERQGVVRGRPEGMSGGISDYLSPRPTTEMVYRSTSTGLQQVSVVHAQTRGAGAGQIQYLFGYAGAGARGEYDGSKLARKRQVLLRLQRVGRLFSWEIGEMFNRHRVGAQGGVQAFAGFEYESIYQRLGASVKDADARRQLARNDLWLTTRLPALGTSLKTFWTNSTLTYRIGSDTTAARVSRLGLDLTQPLLGNRFELSLRGHRDSYRAGDDWRFAPDARTELISALNGKHSLGGGRVAWSAGAMLVDFGNPDVQIDGAQIEPVFSADLEWLAGSVRPFVHFRNGVRLQSASDLYGFGETVSPTRQSMHGRQAVDELGISFRPGWLHILASVAASRTTDGAERVMNADTLQVAPYEGLRTRTSATARLGLREFSRRGMYLWVEATASEYAGDKDAVGETAALDLRLEQSVPSLFGRAAIGIRGIMFKDDLDGDLSIRVRAWNEHRGLRLNPQSGLLALPEVDSRPIEQSMILDLVGIAHIRGATLTVSLENFLSGTVITPGNQLVPDYPYPERRLRFSVFWPIFD